jgi:sulfite exporter TauE/SafE
MSAASTASSANAFAVTMFPVNHDAAIGAASDNASPTSPQSPPARSSRSGATVAVAILLAFLFGILIAVTLSYARDPAAVANLGIVFLTGLTAGGLSCLAVQGGLLASSVAYQLEQDIRQQSAPRSTRTNSTKPSRRQRKHTNPKSELSSASSGHHVAQPILLFLIAKIVAYTLLGFLLGGLGSMLQLTPFMRGILQLTIGLFMIGTALRMFNVHPIFRLFALEPPAFLTRYIRKTARTNTTTLTPIFLGALTVFIPCGVTQAMMALAIGTGSPIAGAAIMAAFILGTCPVFFALAYVATRLGKRLERGVLQVVGAIVLLLGVLAFDSGLNLLGSPISLASLKRSVKSAMQSSSTNPSTNPSTSPSTSHDSMNMASADPGDSPSADPSTTSADPIASTGSPSMLNDGGSVSSSSNAEQSNNTEQPASGNVITINVEQDGYVPDVLYAKAGQPTKLVLVTNNTQSCARAFVIPSLNLQQVLPETGETVIDLPAQSAGALQFTCSMGMYQGYVQFQ